MNRHPLEILFDIAPLILELGEGLRDKPFLLTKTQDAALSLKEVMQSLNAEKLKTTYDLYRA